MNLLSRLTFLDFLCLYVVIKSSIQYAKGLYASYYNNMVANKQTSLLPEIKELNKSETAQQSQQANILDFEL